MEKHIIEDEEESRAYIDQLWAEIFVNALCKRAFKYSGEDALDSFEAII